MFRISKATKQARYTHAALEAQAEWAAVRAADRQPLVEALAAAPRRRPVTALPDRPAPADSAPRVGKAAPASIAPADLAEPDAIGRDHAGRDDAVPARASVEQAPTGDTMIVDAVEAWAIYQRTAAFLTEPGLTCRPVRFLAFSVDGELQREVPRIVAVRDQVPFTASEQRRLMTSGTALDLRLADVIATVRRLGHGDHDRQVYLLTAPLQSGHVTLPGEVARRASRRGPVTALRPRPLYLSVDRLRSGHGR